MDYNVHKICRVCLKDGALTSIYSTEFSMMPSMMLMLCAKIRVYKKDGLPEVICNNCIYRLGAAYHFKQECENSDMRLRQYLGLHDRGYGICDAETNTDMHISSTLSKSHGFTVNNRSDDCEDEDHVVTKAIKKKSKHRSHYQRKPLAEHKKRGPKPLPKLPPTCYECHKIFKCSAQLQMHIRTHTGEKPFACNYCPRRFAQKYNLQIHERTHTGDRPFQCEICSRQFSALGNFQAHLKIHTGIRDQHCPVCQKSFYTGGDLSKHMLTHTGIKNHQCDVCGKAFSRRRDMHTHKRKLHQHLNVLNSHREGETNEENKIIESVINDNFKCPECDKVFESASNLSIHFRTHGANNLLNLPLAPNTQMHSLPPPSLAPTAHHHYHHHHHAAVSSLNAVPHLHENVCHPHTLPHLSLNAATTTLQTTNPAGMSIVHMLTSSSPPPAPTTPAGTSSLALMHTAQRLHPY